MKVFGKSRACMIAVLLAAAAGCGGEGPRTPRGGPAASPPAGAAGAAGTPGEAPRPHDAAKAEGPKGDPAKADPAKPATRVVLRAARAVAPRSGRVTAPAFVTVEGDRIVAVSAEAPKDDARGTSGAPPTTIDLGDVTLTPGLVDAHTHLLDEQPPGEGEGSIVLEAATVSDADRALRATTFARQMLRAGFTTVRDLGNAGRGIDVSLRRAIARGWVEGPTMLVSTRALAPPGGQFPRVLPAWSGLVDREYAIVRSADEARGLVMQASYEGADCIKVIVDQGPNRSLGDAELRAIVETAHRLKKKVAAHALTEEACALAAAAGVDSIEHAYKITDLTLAEMAKKKIFLVPTDYPLDFYTAFAPAEGPGRAAALAAFQKLREGSKDRLRRALRAKVRIAAGADAYTPTKLDDRGKEAALIFRAYAESGMPPLEILRAATSEAADLLGLPEASTSMAPGGVADLVAMRGDPTKDAGAMERVVFVMKVGRVVRREE